MAENPERSSQPGSSPAALDKTGKRQRIKRQDGSVYPQRFRAAAAAIVFLLLFSILIPSLARGILPVQAALAEPVYERNPSEEPDDWTDWDPSEEPYDWEDWDPSEEPYDWEDPDEGEDWNDFDSEFKPFLLVCAEGKEPGVDQESEWMLTLKPDWEDRDLPNRVTSVLMMLYCYNLDWTDNWSHVWKKEYEGLPDRIPCTGVKVAGRYMLSAYVYYDDTYEIISAGFEIGGGGRELITDILSQAAAECKTADEWQTAFNLYRWLIGHLVYDETLSYYSSDAILRGKGVCDSYARLYSLLCREAGLETYVIYGNTPRGYHAWDAVCIDGEWYYADPTWDDHPVNDPAMSTEPSVDENGVFYGVSEYKYFMLNKELMTLNDHLTYEWLDEGKLQCDEQPSTSLAACYYIHTGLWREWGLAEGETFRTIPDMIREALEDEEKMWSSRSVRDRPLNTRGSDEPAFRIADNEIFLLGSLLKGMSLELSDGTSVTLDTYIYAAGDASGRVLNVYQEGAPVTDETGTVELPESLTHIMEKAFEGDRRLGEVICPPGLVSIGSRAFADCKGLWNIRIPSDVQYIAEDAFEGCNDFCIWTEHRDSLPVRYAEEHGIIVFVDDEMEGSNG